MTAQTARFLITARMRRTMTMSDKVQVFEHEKFGSIRTLTRDGEPWFVGNDICEALGYAKPRNAIKKVC